MQIGIDLGGTKIEAIGLDGRSVVAARRRVHTPHDYADTLRAIAQLVDEIEKEVGRSGTVGIGIPGTVSHGSGLVKNANSVWLIGHPLAADIAKKLSREVRVANDANCFALSEATDGAAKDADVVFGVILGTGVGGGITMNGRLHDGPNQIAGEWGHNPMPWMTDDERPGHRCYCGKLGCVETFLSGPGFERDYASLTGTSISSRDIVSAAAEGDKDALIAMARYTDRLARALAVVVNILDPQFVVLGGGMSNLPELPSVVSAALPKYVFNDSVRTKIVLNEHGDSSGVRGAAWLWPARRKNDA